VTFFEHLLLQGSEMSTEFNPSSERFVANLDTWRFILICMVVINHVWLLTTAEADMSALDRATAVLTRASVPALSLFSGYLFAASQSYGFRSLLTKKVKSLILPFLAWNTLAVALLLGANELFRFNPAELIAAHSRYELVNDLTGFHGAPGNAPLYFLRDLFICFLAFTLLRPVLRKPAGLVITFAAVVANYALDFDGRVIIRNSIPVFFLVGFGFRMFPRAIELCSRVVMPAAVATLILLFIWAFGTASWGKASVLNLLTLTCCAGLVVGLAARLRPSPRLAAWGRRYSFAIFLSHWWVLVALEAVWDRMGWEDASYRIVGSLVAILTGILAARLIAYLPGPLAAALSGGRVKKPSCRQAARDAVGAA
jgi:succinoglycan biosynthesis protein ExoH